MTNYVSLASIRARLEASPSVLLGKLTHYWSNNKYDACGNGVAIIWLSGLA